MLVAESLDVGGLAEVVASLAQRLPSRGFEIAVLHAPLDGSQPIGRTGQRLIREGVHVLHGDPDSGPDQLRRWHPDVISLHGSADWVRVAAQDGGTPVVETLHGMHEFFDVDPSTLARRFAGAARVVAVSETVRQQFLAVHPEYPGNRVETIPNALASSRPPVHAPRERVRDALGLTDEFLFVSLSRHCLQKNTFGLVSAFTELIPQLPKAHLVVTGRPDDHPYARQVQRLVERGGSRSQIHLRDHLPEPRTLLAAADGFVLDSFFEGWALASMEALALGIPVIMSEVGGAREQLAGATPRGVLVDNPLGDPLAVSWTTMRDARFAQQVNAQQLVESMSTMVSEADLWRSRRAAIAEESQAQFDEDTWLQQHTEVLLSVATRSVSAVD